MKPTTLLAGLGLSLAFTAAVSADVRVIHGSPDAPNVDVYVNGTPGMDSPAISNLAYTLSSGYIPFMTGNYNFKVTPAGQNNPIVIDVDAFIDGNTDYTIAAGGFLADIAPYVYIDDNTIDENAARVRFIHLSPDAPTVDIFANDGMMPLFDAVSFSESGGYQSVAGGTYDLDVRLDSDGQNVLSVPNVMLENGFVYTIFAMGSAVEGTLQAVVFVDAAIPAPGALALLGVAGLCGSRRRRRTA